MKAAGLSQRLQDAIETEIDFSAALIQTGQPVNVRVLVLGAEGAWRIPLDALVSHTEGVDEWNRGFSAVIRAALLTTAAREFVVSLSQEHSVLAYGVCEHDDGGILVSLADPWGPESISSMRCPPDISAWLRGCVPARGPINISQEFIANAGALFGTGGDFEMKLVDRTAVCSSIEGHA